MLVRSRTNKWVASPITCENIKLEPDVSGTHTNRAYSQPITRPDRGEVE